MSDKQLKEGEEPEVIGSTVIILAEDLATARKVVETDPYWLNGVVSFRTSFLLTICC